MTLNWKNWSQATDEEGNYMVKEAQKGDDCWQEQVIFL